MVIVDLSVSRAVAAATRAGGTLTYSGVQDIIRSVFDYGQITVQEREDLREVLSTLPMDDRANRALTNFLTEDLGLSHSAPACVCGLPRALPTICIVVPLTPTSVAFLTMDTVTLCVKSRSFLFVSWWWHHC
jgi:hypothetical protein